MSHIWASGAALALASTVALPACTAPQRTDAAQPLQQRVSAAADYAIQLHRAYKPGIRERRWSVSTHSMGADFLRAGQVLDEKNETRHGELEADYEVVAVDDLGKPLAGRYTVRSWQGEVNGSPVKDLRRGMVIELDVRGGKVSITSPDGPLSPEVTELLDDVLPDASLPSKFTDDDFLGTSERQHVGDRWPMHAGPFAAAMAEKDMKVDPRDVSGTAQLTKVAPIDDIPCLHVTSRLHASNLEFVLPEGFQITTAETSIDYGVALPVAKELLGPQTGEMAMRVDVTGEKGEFQMKVRIRSERSVRAVLLP